MQYLILYALLTTSFYYLGAWAKVTTFLHSRYPSSFDEFMRCPACSGFWYGLLIGAFGSYYMRWSIFALPRGLAVLTVGLCSVVWTPLLAIVLLRAFEELWGLEKRIGITPDE